MPVQLSGYEDNTSSKQFAEITVTKAGTKSFLDVLPLIPLVTRIYDYDTRNDGQPVYVGYAAPGTLVTAASWLIVKTTYNSDGFVTNEQFASGTNKFDKIWNSRATYDYS